MDASRLVNGEGSAFEQVLLREGAAEAPSSDLEALMMSGVPLAPPGAAGPMPSPSASIPPSAAALPWKVLLASGGLGLSLLVGTGLWLSASDGDPGSAVQAPPAVDGASSQAAAQAKVAPDEGSDAASAVEATPGPDPSATPAAPQGSAAKVVGTKVPGVSSGAAGSQLAQELRQLEQARAALRGDRPEAALAILDRYDARFPASTLRQEAIVLRAKALQARGQTKEAESLKQDFRKMHPQSAHSRQMQGSSDE